MIDPADTSKLLNLLDIEDEELFRIKVIETLGEVVLMLHWIRGLFGWLTFTGAVEFETSEQLKNYRNMLSSLELYETFIWETVPARAMLLQLREFRNTGTLFKDFEKLMVQDAHGRIPYGIDEKHMNDIQELLKRLAEARVDYKRKLLEKEDPSKDYGHAGSVLSALGNT